MFGSENTRKLLTTLKEVYDEHIVIKTRFEALKDITEKSLSEYKRLNERLIEKIEEQEKARARSEAGMLSQIASLQARLDAFSDKAMRSAVTDLADRYLRDQFGRRVVPALDGPREVNDSQADEDR